MLLGLIFFTIFPVTFNANLRLVEASRGTLVLATIPIWSALLARVARSERLVFRQVVGIFLSLGAWAWRSPNAGWGTRRRRRSGPAPSKGPCERVDDEVMMMMMSG
jgi:hypothetical protein